MKESVKSVDMGKTPNSSFSVTCVFLCVRSSLAFHLNFANRQSFQKLFLVTRQRVQIALPIQRGWARAGRLINETERGRESARKRVWWIKCPLLKCSDPTCQLHHSEWSITAHISKTLLLSSLFLFLSSPTYKPSLHPFSLEIGDGVTITNCRQVVVSQEIGQWTRKWS